MQKKTDILLWGAGNDAEKVWKCLRKSRVNILGVIDKKATDSSQQYWKKILMFSPDHLTDFQFAYVIITSSKYAKEIYQELVALGVGKERIVDFWNDEAVDTVPVFNSREMAWQKNKRHKTYLQLIAYSQRFPYLTSKKIQKFLATRLFHEPYDEPIIIGNKNNIKYILYFFPENRYQIFSAAIEYLFLHELTEKRHLIPLVCLTYSENVSSRQIDETNLWTFVFQQEAIDRVLINSNVGVAVEQAPSEYSKDLRLCLEINGEVKDSRIHAVEDQWRSYYKKIKPHVQVSWRFKDEIVNQCRSFFQRQTTEKDKVVGVMLREQFSPDWFDKLPTEEYRQIFQQHPMGPGISEIADILKGKKNSWGITKIFVATEFQDSLQYFEEQFGKDSVFFLPRVRRTLQEGIAQLHTDVHYDEVRILPKELKEKEITYTQEIILLSFCNYLIAPHCGGSSAALAINGGEYEDIMILRDENHIKDY